MQKNEELNFSEIPAEAMRMTLGEFELSDNGENAKTAPIKMLARSSEPLEHWFWGKVVHDFDGVKMKSRIPVDYAHDDKEIIGYLNKSDITPEGLQMSGALVPYKDSDRATEIIFKQKQGVPYEASINFAAPVEYEKVRDGETASVNGSEFSGPGIIIRKWSLRGVAVCPYGCDSNTESVVNFANSKKFSGKIINSKNEVDIMPEIQKNEEEKMSEETKVEETKVVESPETKHEELSEKQEAAPEAKAEEKAEPKAVEGEKKEFSISKSELEKMSAEFGAEIAMKAALSGGGYAEAQSMAFAALKSENEALKKHVSDSAKGGPSPVNFSEGEKKKCSLLDVIKSKK